jgi:hypothetical protein
MSTDQQETDQRATIQPVSRIRSGFCADPDPVPDPGTDIPICNKKMIRYPREVPFPPTCGKKSKRNIPVTFMIICRILDNDDRTSTRRKPCEFLYTCTCVVPSKLLTSTMTPNFDRCRQFG